MNSRDFLRSLEERERSWWEKTRRRKGRVPLGKMYLVPLNPTLGLLDDGKKLWCASERMCPAIQFYLEDFQHTHGLREIERTEAEPWAWLLEKTTRDPEDAVSLEVYIQGCFPEKCS